jgi:hypothetical protein
MDILGYREMIETSEKEGEQQELLTKLHKVLADARGFLENTHPDIVEIYQYIEDDFALKAFTDNIVIGWPIEDDAESETGVAFSKLAQFQFSMAIEGFFVRGAVSIGLAYIDEIAVFGNALTQAYVGEATLARDPRIILMPSMAKAVKQHLKYYDSATWAPQTRDLLCDSDGQWFINYLDYILSAEEEIGPYYKGLLDHKVSVEQKLHAYKVNPNIFAKYAWVAGYHNFFCDLHSKYFSDEHKINIELFRAPPKLIIDEESSP